MTNNFSLGKLLSKVIRPISFSVCMLTSFPLLASEVDLPVGTDSAPRPPPSSPTSLCG